MDRATDF